MKIYRVVFRPVVEIEIKAESADKALTLANDCMFGPPHVRKGSGGDHVVADWDVSESTEIREVDHTLEWEVSS